jgi:hypothetical protein
VADHFLAERWPLDVPYPQADFVEDEHLVANQRVVDYGDLLRAPQKWFNEIQGRRLRAQSGRPALFLE